MKITIELSDAEVRGIKKFNRVVYDDTVGKKEIARMIANIVNYNLHSDREAVSGFIKEFEDQALVKMIFGNTY